MLRAAAAAVVRVVANEMAERAKQVRVEEVTGVLVKAVAAATEVMLVVARVEVARVAVVRVAVVRVAVVRVEVAMAAVAREVVTRVAPRALVERA